MRLDVQLYIDGQRADLFNDESISITSSIQNVKDISKVFAEYSQTFSLPASRTNNKIFKHYYNPDVLNGFDARFKAEGLIELNYSPFRKGKIKLEEVELKNNKPYAYRVTFFSDIVALKDVLGEDQLDSLDLSAYDVAYNYTSIETGLSTGITKNGITNAIVTPLISAQERWFYDTAGSASAGNLANSSHGGNWTSLKYAIRLHCLLLAIQEKYTIANEYPINIVFSDDFFVSSNAPYYNLYMWLHREKGAITTRQNQPEAITGLDEDNTFYGVEVGNGGSRIDFTDVGGIDNVTYKHRLQIVVDSSSASFQVRAKINGVAQAPSATLTGATSYSVNLPIVNANGYYEFEILPDDNFDIISIATNPSTYTYYYVTRFENATNIASNEYELETDITVSDVNFTVISDNIPKMKIIDFLTALFKMFNLTAYVVDDEIIVKDLNSFYSSGTPIDITKYVDVSQTKVKPLTLFSDITFEYSGLGSLLAQNHLEQFNADWGTEEYIPEEFYKVDGQKYSVSVPFEHMKYERIIQPSGSVTTVQWGWMVDKLNNDGTATPYIGLPLVFYPVLHSGNDIYIYNGSSRDLIEDYFVPSNSLSLDDATSAVNINFKQENNEYDSLGEFDETLFNQYYESYISSVFAESSRLVTVKAYLPFNVLSAYELNDSFVIGGREYNINSITTNLTTGESDIELQNKIN